MSFSATSTACAGSRIAQFHPLEEALAATGVTVWPMVELEADDALASAAHLAGADARIEKVSLRWRGPIEDFDAWATKIGDARLPARSRSTATTA